MWARYERWCSSVYIVRQQKYDIEVLACRRNDKIVVCRSLLVDVDKDLGSLTKGQLGTAAAPYTALSMQIHDPMKRHITANKALLTTLSSTRVTKNSHQRQYRPRESCLLYRWTGVCNLVKSYKPVFPGFFHDAIICRYYQTHCAVSRDIQFLTT